MPTLKALVGKIKEDNTFPIMIQLYHSGEKRYLPTGYFVVKRQLKANGELKDQFVIDKVTDDMRTYREKLLKLSDINHLSAEYLKIYLLRKEVKTDIDFVDIGREFIKTQVESTGKNTETALSSFIDFVGYDKINIAHINLRVLKSYEEYLRTERKVSRDNGNGGTADRFLKPMKNTGIRDYIGKLRQIFKAAQEKYNDEEKGIIPIPHYPFGKFKMPRKAKAKKRNLKPSEVKLIRDCPDISRRADLGRDVFMLSFYLVGMNLADLFAVNEYKNGRISYRRAKTESRKGEDSFISIKVELEAVPLIEKYLDPKSKRVFRFYLDYSDSDGFVKAVNMGLKSVCAKINEKKELIEPATSSYYARGGWSTIAFNLCKISKDIINFCLNHAAPEFSVTDLYIEEDYGMIDRANRKVLNKLR